MPEVGMQGQRKLKASSVLMIGTGGLGAPVGMYLAAAGVGRIGIVDFDVVEESNLQRQIIHGTKDLGRRKIESARDRLRDINPHIEIETHESRLTSHNAMQLFRNYDIIVDGTDNFPTRYLVNDACVLSKKPNVYGSIFRFEGQASVFWAEKGACYRCLYPEPPPPGLVPSCAEGGVLGVLPGLVGTIQATEALKLLLGTGEPLIGRLLLIDALRMEFKTVKLRKDPDCPACGTREITVLREETPACTLTGPALEEEITPRELADRLADGDPDLLLVDVREPHEWEICHLDGATLLPLGELPESVANLPSDREVVIYCKGGVRGAKAVSFLKNRGFSRVRNLTGGINRWSEEVDSTIPRY
jgi:adenylyltransferase/sulfurtransferase